MPRVEIFHERARRRWSEADKRRLVAEMFTPGETVHGVARRRGVSTSQLFTWRKRFRAEVELPLGTVRAAVARVTVDGLAFVVLGGAPDQQRLAALAESAPLLAALVHAENRVRAAEGEANVARAMGRRASELANALDGARSDLQRALEDAAKLNAELQENNRRKDEFLAMLGHELRNPMAAIAGALEVMRQTHDASAGARARSDEAGGPGLEPG